ncbi:MAG: AMP-binding protein [Anaerolineae bacterium]|nr:AMP-binding protein [Gemmatimonadaceae bacterium]
MHLTALFDLSLIGRADTTALEYYDAGGTLHALTFGQVEARANQMAHELRARGVAQGDRLCVHITNRIEFIDLFLACTRLGVIFVPMNALYRERELRHIIGDCDPKAVVTPSESDELYPDGAVLWRVEELAAAAAERPATRLLTPLDGDEPAMIVYTSGTTGAAKGAVLSHNNLAANGVNLVSCWRITDADRYLAVLPLFHVHGLGNGIHCWLISGCLMRLAERFDQRTVASIFRDFVPTLFFGVPTMYVRLLDPAVISDLDAKLIGASARLFVSGSAPLPAHVLEAFDKRYAHVILERYGMSESLMISSNPYEGERRAGTVGVPLPGVSVRLVGSDDALVADGEVGEVHIRSPALCAEYWRQADATAAAFTDGWFRTGDLAVRSADGYYALRGRRGDMIISGGFNIYPREVEELLLEDSRVSEAAVVGVADSVRGEIPIAYIVAEDGLHDSVLAERCRAQMASFKAPHAFVRMKALPRTALGKVQKHMLPPWKQ